MRVSLYPLRPADSREREILEERERLLRFFVARHIPKNRLGLTTHSDDDGILSLGQATNCLGRVRLKIAP